MAKEIIFDTDAREELKKGVGIHKADKHKTYREEDRGHGYVLVL